MKNEKKLWGKKQTIIVVPAVIVGLGFGVYITSNSGIDPKITGFAFGVTAVFVGLIIYFIARKANKND